MSVWPVERECPLDMEKFQLGLYDFEFHAIENFVGKKSIIWDRFSASFILNTFAIEWLTAYEKIIRGDTQAEVIDIIYIFPYSLWWYL